MAESQGSGSLFDALPRVLADVTSERERQERKGAEHRARGQEHWRSCADPLLPDERKLAVLLEEVGEVAHAQNETWVGQPSNLREELIHVAAVAVAWAESLTPKPAGQAVGEDFVAMVADMKDPAAAPCSCGFPEKPCLRVILRNGPPYPPRPCEPV